jgi:hypothetical protein
VFFADNNSGQFFSGHTGFLYQAEQKQIIQLINRYFKPQIVLNFIFKNIYVVNYYGTSSSDIMLQITGYRNGVSTVTITAHADNAQYGQNLSHLNSLTPSIFQCRQGSDTPY